ncbi:MAG: DNA replication complex GINS family protein [Desulfurococcales archaeon]|nr:DNA replication complex GINS family protein [Desulfurococcales archaeon]
MDIGSKLRLILYDYMVRPVRVVFKESTVEPVPTPNGRAVFRKGDEVDLPRWQARLLAERGIVEVRDQPLDIDSVNMFHYKEKRRSAANQLSPLPQDFYPKAFELVERLDEMIRNKPFHMLLKDREILEKNLVELAEARLAKIIRLAMTEEGGVREKLTPEETVVYDMILATIREWRNYVKTPFRQG